MKKVISSILFQLFLLTSFAQELRVGISSATINPPLGSFIAGDKQNRSFTGIHDNLYAKAVVISSDKESIAILTLDCIGLLYSDVLKIRQKAAEICRISPERVIVSSTHTHAGPDVVGIWGKDFTVSGVDDAYMNFLILTAAEQVKRAYENQQKALGYTTETIFGADWVENICNEEIDRTVSILQLKDMQQNVIATLTNFACHPTFMDAVTTEVSADFIHGYYKELKKRAGGEVLFLQGAIGGWIQPEKEPKTFENAYKRGKELADVVYTSLKNAQPFGTNLIQFKRKKILIPVENEGWKQLSSSGIIKRKINETVETELAFFKIGSASFITHPGETAPYYGLESKKMMGEGTKFVLGLGNDALGYILKPSYFEDESLPHAAYLTQMSVGKQAGPLVLEGIKSLLLEDKK